MDNRSLRNTTIKELHEIKETDPDEYRMNRYDSNLVEKQNLSRNIGFMVTQTYVGAWSGTIIGGMSSAGLFYVINRTPQLKKYHSRNLQTAGTLLGAAIGAFLGASVNINNSASLVQALTSRTIDPKKDKSAISLIKKYKNLFVTRSFSKIYGLASLRIGYGISSEKNIEKLKLYKQPFNTNLFAQKAAELV